MSAEFKARPLRSLRHEALTLLELATVPAAVAFAFPYEAVGFRASRQADVAGCTCAFVTLNEKEERSALAAARTSWQVDAKGVRALRTDLSTGELPPSPVYPIIPERQYSFHAWADAPYSPNALPPSVAAPPPRAIAPDDDAPAKPKLAFPREELGRIDVVPGRGGTD